MVIVIPKFFHKTCSERRRNCIGNLKKVDRGWVVNEKEKKAFIAIHFVQLFRSSGGHDEGRVQQIIEVVQPHGTPHMNELLTVEFTANEV